MLNVKIKPNDLEENRFHIVVSTKVSKKAVQRNKIKRRIREILRKMDLPIGYDIIIYTNKKIIGKTYQEIKQVLEEKIQNSNF